MLITFILLFVNLSLIIGKTIEQFTKCYCIGYLALVLILCFETVQVSQLYFTKPFMWRPHRHTFYLSNTTGESRARLLYITLIILLLLRKFQSLISECIIYHCQPYYFQIEQLIVLFGISIILFYVRQNTSESI